MARGLELPANLGFRFYGPLSDVAAIAEKRRRSSRIPLFQALNMLSPVRLMLPSLHWELPWVHRKTLWSAFAP